MANPLQIIQFINALRWGCLIYPKKPRYFASSMFKTIFAPCLNSNKKMVASLAKKIFHNALIHFCLNFKLVTCATTQPCHYLEVNDAAYEGHRALAETLERAQRAGWVRSDVSAMTLAVWVRSMIFGRLVLEVDPDRYDGTEWNHLAISSFERTLAAGHLLEHL